MGKAKVALMLAVLPATCEIASYTAYPATDPFGNVYPIECRRDLSHVVATVVYASPDDLEQIRSRLHKTKGRLYGLTWKGSMIVIDNSLDAYLSAEVLHHEKCHVLMGQWHPEQL